MRIAPPVSPAPVMAAMLLAFAGCDKTPERDPAQILPVGATPFDLDHPTPLIFQVFGEAAAPKIMAIATVRGGAIEPIGLTRDGWRRFDSTYFAPGRTYTIYVDDGAAGTATVTRGMWVGGDTTLYPLPGCTDLRPLGAVALQMGRQTDDPNVELIATQLPLKPHPGSARPFPPSETIARLGRAHGLALGLAHGMDKDELDSLDFIARMIRTGARTEPTLLVSFIDQQAGDVAPGVGHTSHMLALFDKADTGYAPTYRHVKSGDARTVEFQRVIDHLDVDGDGVDELVLEAWHYGGSNDLVVLAFKAGQWHEALRTSSSWCLDPSKQSAP